MSKAKVTISSSSIPATVVNPVFSGDFTYTKDKKRIRYAHEISSDLTFRDKKDYDLLIALQSNECEVVTVDIKWLCGNNVVDYWQGEFTFLQCNPNKTKKYIKVKPKQKSPYKCLDDSGKLEVSLFGAGNGNITSKVIVGDYETMQCNFTTPSNDNDISDYFNLTQNGNADCLPDPANWYVLSNKVFINGVYYGNSYPQPYPPNEGTGWTLSQETIWHRETFETDCVNGSPVPPTFGTWTLLQDNCGTTNNSIWIRNPPVQVGGFILGDYTRGRLFKDVLIHLIGSLNCSLTVKSDFFNINPVGDAPTNIAYDYAASYLHHLTLHQKSDIKLFSGENFSSDLAWRVKPESFLDDLIAIFNLGYVIEENIFVLEHASFFTSSPGWNLTDKAIEEDLNYAEGANTKTEKFFWAEEYLYSSFESEPIIYDCGENTVDVRCKYLVTDLAFVQREINYDKVANTGFCLISNTLINSQLIIIDSNYPLKWKNLQDNLFLHNRLYKTGTVNGVQHNFLTWQPYIKGKEFSHVYQCSDNFSPVDSVETKIGVGYLTTAKHNIFNCSLLMNLNY